MSLPKPLLIRSQTFSSSDKKGRQVLFPKQKIHSKRTTEHQREPSWSLQSWEFYIHLTLTIKELKMRLKKKALANLRCRRNNTRATLIQHSPHLAPPRSGAGPAVLVRGHRGLLTGWRARLNHWGKAGTTQPPILHLQEITAWNPGVTKNKHTPYFKTNQQ